MTYIHETKPNADNANQQKSAPAGPPESVWYELDSPPATLVYEVYGKMPRRIFRGIHKRQFHPEQRLQDHNPVAHPRPGLITPDTPVATIGSCFVVAIRNWLIRNGFNHVQTETGPGADKGSARFGRVYSTACLRQVIESGFGLFNPIEQFWTANDLLLDPYREGIGWPDESSARVERESHMGAVREMIESARVLICTMGVSEVWRHREDRATYFRLPPEEVYDEAKHEFVLLSVEENVANLEAMYALVRERNPELQLVVTLSPVPLRMTFRDMSCVTADAVSKSILRVALDEFCRRHPEVIYFPAFEIVRSMSPAPFLDDNRHVDPNVVRYIMGLFMRHYGPG